MLTDVFGTVNENEWFGLKNFKFYEDVLGYLYKE
jgi:hypothetical protein